MDKPLKILVADDDRAIVDAICMYLEFEGYAVESTFDGSDVLSLAETLPDLIILDIWMSGVDGMEICRQLKKEKRVSHIPVLMISASRDLQRSAQQAGADGFLAKPFDMEELTARIAALTQKS
jgi:DNA-binding response OmpR family regulator